VFVNEFCNENKGFVTSIKSENHINNLINKNQWVD